MSPRNPRPHSQPGDAVERLVLAIDAVDREQGGVWLRGVEAGAVHDAAVTLLLRAAFLLQAERLGRITWGPPLQAARYGLTPLHRELLSARRCLGVEALRARHDAFARLVRTSRAVHAGVAALGVIAHGGLLFDPERYPFVEGPAAVGPPPIDDDTVLALLEAAAPDDEPEHLGQLRERLLGQRAERPTEPLLRLQGATDVLLSELEARAAEGEAALVAWLTQRTGRTARAVCKALSRPAAEPAAGADEPALARRLGPWLALLRRGDGVVPAGHIVVTASLAQRQTGAHYTPRALTESVVEATLAPFVKGDHEARRPRDAQALLALRVLDMTMGTGAFLLQACRYLGARVAEAWAREGARADDEAAQSEARRLVAERCLYGVDISPLAVEIARLSLWLLAAPAGAAPSFVGDNLQVGDASLGVLRLDGDGLSPVEADRAVDALRGDGPARAAFHWPLAFPSVMAAGGFDAVVGNPPWVAYAGRAAQPLEPDLRRYHLSTCPAFASYRTLHGIFVQRAATLLAPGGRLGLVLPTSVADLDGYAPTRAAHDALCEPDEELLDFGDGAFEGVFQPAMALTSTRRREPPREVAPRVWPLARGDLGAADQALLAMLKAATPLPPDAFGERGYQTTSADRAVLSSEPGEGHVPLRAGTDIDELTLHAPRHFVLPERLSARLRPAEAWAAVDVLIRQTARYPIAAVADGVAFRNSILAGFAVPPWTPPALAVYLNASAIRWHHYHRFRDARQGMPQVKIGHLRAVPAPPAERLAALVDWLDALGRQHCGRLANELRHSLDERVGKALGLDEAQRAHVGRWWATGVR